VVAHNSLGFGDPSLNYPFIPIQQPGIVDNPLVGLATDALDLVRLNLLTLTDPLYCLIHCKLTYVVTPNDC
jgi:hypothetical protein